MAKFKGKTISIFSDLKNNNKIYEVGTLYETDDEQRFKELLGNNSYKRAFVEVIEEEAEVEETEEIVDVSKLSKDELKEELEAKGIEYSSKANKAELVELLEAE